MSVECESPVNNIVCSTLDLAVFNYLFSINLFTLYFITTPDSWYTNSVLQAATALTMLSIHYLFIGHFIFYGFLSGD